MAIAKVLGGNGEGVRLLWLPASVEIKDLQLTAGSALQSQDSLASGRLPHRGPGHPNRGWPDPRAAVPPLNRRRAAPPHPALLSRGRLGGGQRGHPRRPMPQLGPQHALSGGQRRLPVGAAMSTWKETYHSLTTHQHT